MGGRRKAEEDELFRGAGMLETIVLTSANDGDTLLPGRHYVYFDSVPAGFFISSAVGVDGQIFRLTIATKTALTLTPQVSEEVLDLANPAGDSSPRVCVSPQQYTFRSLGAAFGVGAWLMSYDSVLLVQDCVQCWPDPLPAYTVSNAGNSNQVLTADVVGALTSARVGSPSVGDILLIAFEAPQVGLNGAYRVDAVGDGSNPWVLVGVVLVPATNYRVRYFCFGDSVLNPFANTEWLGTADVSALSDLVLLTSEPKLPSGTDVADAALYPNEVRKADVNAAPIVYTIPDLPSGVLDQMQVGVSVVEPSDTNTVQVVAQTGAQIVDPNTGLTLASVTLDARRRGRTTVWRFDRNSLVWRVEHTQHDRDHGTYTPTLYNDANLDSSTAYPCQWTRVGNVVTVSGLVDVDPTTTTLAVALGVSLPIGSNFGNTEECAGVATANEDLQSDPSASISADAVNNRARMAWRAVSVVSHRRYFSFTYQIL